MSELALDRLEDRRLIWIDTSHRRTGRTQFASLEYLRVLASFMIIIFHAHSISLKNAIRQGVDYFEAPIFWYSCIEIFFVMSGFLMVHMSRSLYGRDGGVLNFTLRRLARTPPLYWIYTIGIAALFLVRPDLSSGGPMDLPLVLGSLAFVPMDRPPVIAIGWTLQYEVYFYTIIGISIFLPYARAWKFAMAVLIVAVLAGLVLDVKRAPWTVWTDPTLLDFVVGMGVAVAYHSGVNLSRWGRWIAFAAGIVLICSLNRLVDRDLLRFATMGLGVGLVVCAATLSEKQWSLGPFHKIAHELSNQTYTMYLSHILLLKVLEIVYFRIFSGRLAAMMFIIVGFVVVVAVSRVLYLVGEKPLTEHLRKFLQRVQGPKPA